MAAVAVLAIGLALVGAGLGRWTRWHPLAIGLMIGTLTAGPALLLFGAMMSPAALAAAMLVGLIAAGPTTFGAFVGWLRRKNLEGSR